jgi:hypothetical protein
MTDRDQNRADESQAAAPLRVKYIVEPEDYLALAAQLGSKQPKTIAGWYLRVLPSLCAAAVVITLFSKLGFLGFSLWEALPIGVIFNVAIIYYWFFVVSPRARIRNIRRNRPSWLGEKELTINTRGLRFVGPSIETLFEFSTIQKMEENGVYVFLRIDTENGKDKGSLVIHRHRVTEGDLDTFVSAIRARLATAQPVLATT